MLTRLLQDSIGGRRRTTIVLTVGPSSDHLHDAKTTLQFGLRAMAVKGTPSKKVEINRNKIIERLKGKLDGKEDRISSLEIQVASLSTEMEKHTYKRHIYDGGCGGNKERMSEENEESAHENSDGEILLDVDNKMATAEIRSLGSPTAPSFRAHLEGAERESC